MTISLILIAIIIGFMIIRYFPVWDAKCIRNVEAVKKHITLVDVRDYNQSYKDSINGTFDLPVAYLKRYYHEIPSMEVHIIASTHLEKNMSIRFLRRKGFKVRSYTITDCDCQKRFLQSA